MGHVLFWFYLKLPIVTSVSTDSGPTSMKPSGRTVLGFTPPPVMLRFLTSRNCLCFCWGEISTSPGPGSSQLTNPTYTLFNSRFLLYLLPVILLWWDSHLSWFPFYPDLLLSSLVRAFSVSLSGASIWTLDWNIPHHCPWLHLSPKYSGLTNVSLVISLRTGDFSLLSFSTSPLNNTIPEPKAIPSKWLLKKWQMKTCIFLPDWFFEFQICIYNCLAGISTSTFNRIFKRYTSRADLPSPLAHIKSASCIPSLVHLKEKAIQKAPICVGLFFSKPAPPPSKY